MLKIKLKYDLFSVMVMDTYELLLNSHIIYWGSRMLYILILKLPWNMKAIECGMCNYGFESCLSLPESNNLTDKQLCFSGQQQACGFYMAKWRHFVEKLHPILVLKPALLFLVLLSSQWSRPPLKQISQGVKFWFWK